MEQGDDGGKRWGIIGSCIVGLHKASVTTTRATEGKQPHLAGRSHPAAPDGKRSWHSKGFSLQNIRSSQSFVLEAEVEGVPCWLVGALAGGSWSGLVGASK